MTVRHFSTSILLLIVCWTLARCDSSKTIAPAADGGAWLDGGALNDGPPIAQVPDGGASTLAELCDRQAAIVCGPVPACCGQVVPEAADPATCATVLREICLAQGKAEQAAIGAGSAAIDPAGLRACETAVAAASAQCRAATADGEQAICAGSVLSLAAIGGACDADLDGARCAGGDGICFPQPTGVSCRAWSQEGTACSAGPCAPGLMCLPGGAADQPQVCARPRAAGGVCGADVHCAEGLACFGGTCGPALAEGTPCSNSSKCLPQLMCDLLGETCATRLAAGASCYQSRHCRAGLLCTGVQQGLVCIPGAPGDGDDTPGLPGLGERCTDACAKGLKCDTGPIPGRCIPSLCAAVLQVKG